MLEKGLHAVIPSHLVGKAARCNTKEETQPLMDAALIHKSGESALALLCFYASAAWRTACWML